MINEYLINAVKRVIVPKGLKEVTIQIGEYIVTVRADGTNNVSLAHWGRVPLLQRGGQSSNL